VQTNSKKQERCRDRERHQIGTRQPAYCICLDLRRLLAATGSTEYPDEWGPSPWTCSTAHANFSGEAIPSNKSGPRNHWVRTAYRRIRRAHLKVAGPMFEPDTITIKAGDTGPPAGWPRHNTGRT